MGLIGVAGAVGITFGAYYFALDGSVINGIVRGYLAAQVVVAVVVVLELAYDFLCGPSTNNPRE